MAGPVPGKDSQVEDLAFKGHGKAGQLPGFF
jgi:hypothetical protein